MSDTGEMYSDLKKHNKAKKRVNLEASTKMLEDAGIPFIKKNGGVHLIVGDGAFDFWPSTGLFINRANQKQGRGVKNLLKALS